MTLDQNVIAMIYDFDMTLTNQFMQEPLFKKYGIDYDKFWKETNQQRQQIEKEQGVEMDFVHSYMNAIIDKINSGALPNVSNRELKELGKEITFFPGLPVFFREMNDLKKEEPYLEFGIEVEQYIISSGLKPMIEGSLVGPYMKGIFASTFVEVNGVIAKIGSTVTNMEKTSFLHMINKGSNIHREINVNTPLAKEKRRIPFEYMIYIDDGETGIPCFATLESRGGTGIAVYNPLVPGALRVAKQLAKDRRVLTFLEADYSQGGHTSNVLKDCVREIADLIVEKKREEIRRGTKLNLGY